MNPLQERLAVLRRRWWLIVSCRGTAWVLAILLTSLAVGGFVDWRLHLPSLLRAVLLTATLAGAAHVGWHYLLLPLSKRVDDLSLALRVEAHYPALVDSLASAVEFLREPADSVRSGSPSLRREAVQRAIGQARTYDFASVVDTRGVRAAGLSLLTMGGLALFLTLTYPQMAWTAFLRLTHPFGGYDWPRKTHLELDFLSPTGKGEMFEIHGQVSGVVPERATVHFRFRGAPPVEQTYEVKHLSENSGVVLAKLEGGRVLEDFQFQVRANDAISAWLNVEVLPPPHLIPIGGRPSPLIHLQPPAYTDLPAQDLPDATSSLETIAGTVISLQAAVDRPIVRAWLEYPPDLDSTMALAGLASALGTPTPTNELQAAALLASPWRKLPAQLRDEGRFFSLQFPARVSGTFALRWEDGLGLINGRLLELRTIADPAPLVHLERPSRTRDGLEILPDADITVQVDAEDPLFAVRSVYLEYRRRHGEEPALALADRLQLYDGAIMGQITPALFGLLPTNGFVVPTPLNTRTPRVAVGRRWSLRGLNLRQGDVLTIQACADDFDDVSVNKQPGRTHEIELRVVSRTAFDLQLNEAQGQIQQEIIRLQKQQQEALAKVIPAEAQWRNQGTLDLKQMEELIQAEQLQQQIRSRVGTKQEGLRADVARVLQALQDNNVPRSGTQDRMEAVAAELDRLVPEHLEQIEPRLTEARKENESGPTKRTPAENSKAPLPQAKKHQEESAQTFQELLKMLEPWSHSREVRGEAKSILDEQQKLQDQTENLAKEIPQGTTRAQLDPGRVADLEKTAELQNKLADRASQLQSKMERLAAERQSEDPDLAKQLKEAAKRSADRNVPGKMAEAKNRIRDNQLADAAKQQEAAGRAMEEVVKALDEQREEELDRLVKKMKDAEDKLADLADRQEALQKKVKDAAQMSDPKQREEVLKRLAREQEELQKETQEMVRQLMRMRSRDSSQTLSQSAGRMEQAGRQMTQGDDAGEEQEEALERLNEARQKLERERQDVEEELAREKLARVTDQIKAIRERQLALNLESGRIHREVLQRRKWERSLESSLLSLRDAQAGLADETEKIAKEKLENARVFAHLLNRAAEAMKETAERLENRLNKEENAADDAAAPDQMKPQVEEAAQAEITLLQKNVLSRLDHLLEALKPDADKGALSSPKPDSSGEGGGGSAGGGGSGGNEEAIPQMAQFKALRALQQDINAQTKLLGKSPASDKRRDERLRKLRQEQQEITNLFQELTRQVEQEREQP